MFRRLFHPDPIAESTPPAKTETKAPAQEAPKPRRTALRPTTQSVRKPVAGTDRATKEAIADKLGDRLQDVANNKDAEKVKVKSHFRTKLPKLTQPPPDPTPEAEVPAKEEAAVEPKKESEGVSSAAGEHGEATGAAANPAEKEPSLLPDSHKRSLINYGWTEQEIEDGMKANPAAFVATAAKLHDTRKKEVEAYTRAGQAGLKPAEQKQEAPAVVAPQGNNEQRAIARWAGIKKAYPGNEAIFDAISAGEIEQARTEDKRASQQREELLKQQVSNFFSGKTTENYKDFYHDAAEGQTRRDKVVNTAAWIINGAAAQGRMIGVDEALLMAHDSTSSPVTKAAVRKEITGEIASRAATLTQKNQAGPSSKNTATPKGPPSKEELLKRTGERMRAAGLVGR